MGWLTDNKVTFKVGDRVALLHPHREQHRGRFTLLTPGEVVEVLHVDDEFKRVKVKKDDHVFDLSQTSIKHADDTTAQLAFLHSRVDFLESKLMQLFP